MTALQTALRTALRTDVAIAALVPGGIHADSAQSGTLMPYLVWNYMGAIRPDYKTGYRTATPQIERHLFRFRTFAISKLTAIACSEAVENLLVKTPPVLVMGTIMQILKEAELVELDPDLSHEGEEVWCSTLQLEVMIERLP